ncbi:MAG: YezD family protein [Armatimonadetes bacterium]|nr:YezD family protein [Armatimonadota bacterium]
MSNRSNNNSRDLREEIVLEDIRKTLKGLRFGSVTIIVQDGIVVQIDRTSKNRVDYSALDKVSEGEGI